MMKMTGGIIRLKSSQPPRNRRPAEAPARERVAGGHAEEQGRDRGRQTVMITEPRASPGTAPRQQLLEVRERDRREDLRRHGGRVHRALERGQEDPQVRAR